MDKQFSLYLTKIGILDKKTSSSIIKYDDDSINKSFTDKSFYFLMNYFDNLNEEQKKYMSYYIPLKYKLLTKKYKIEKIKSIFIQLLLRNKFIVLKYFDIWKNKINNLADDDFQNIEKFEEKNNYDEQLNKIHLSSQNSFSLDDFIIKNLNHNENRIYGRNNNKQKNYISNIKSMYNYNTINISSYNTKNKSKNLINQTKQNKKRNSYKNYNNQNNFRKRSYPDKELYNASKTPTNKNMNKKGHVLTSLEEKEMEELKECTFKPKINKSISDKSRCNHTPEYRQSSSLLSQRRFQSTFDKLYHDNEIYKLSKEMKTIDHEYLLGKKSSFIPKVSNNFNFRKSFTKYDQNFQERQKEYLFNKNKKNEELKRKKDSDCEIMCSFNPRITNDQGQYYQVRKKEKNLSVPVFKRLYDDCKQRKNLREQQEKENINKFHELSNKLNKKKVDNNLINRLHENNKEDVINKIREKVDKEKGITFKPNIEQNDYIKNVGSTFEERNKKLLFNKKQALEEEKMRQEEYIKNNYGNKNFTKDTRTQIINNIIKRLYINPKNVEQKENEENVKDFKSMNIN